MVELTSTGSLLGPSADRAQAMLVGRAWSRVDGAVLVAVRGDDLVDALVRAPTSSVLHQPAGSRRRAPPGRVLPVIAPLATVLANSDEERARPRASRGCSRRCDLQAIKAAGVNTFVASMLERVGSRSRRAATRRRPRACDRDRSSVVIGDNLSSVRPVRRRRRASRTC